MTEQARYQRSASITPAKPRRARVEADDGAPVRIPADRHVVSFSVSCLPVPQPRQRHRVVRSGARAYAQNYTPTTHPVNGFKAMVAMAAKQRWTEPPTEGPLEVRLRFRFWLPVSAKASMKAHVALGRTWAHTTKPDAENLAKSVLDCLTGIVWRDDRQVARLVIDKVYANEPGVDVWVADYV